MIGVCINSAAIIAGSFFGVALGHKISKQLKDRMPMTFGIASMGLGIAMIVKVQSLPAVILAFLIGTILGELLRIEDNIQNLILKLRSYIIRKFFKKLDNEPSPHAHMQKFIALMIIFSVSGTGIFGALNEGMTGDCSLLVVKSFLDLLTAAIFAVSMGISVASLAIPQFTIQVMLYFGAQLILPLTTPALIADFSAVGGLVMLASGFRICEMKPIPVANMLPGLLLVMPISYWWNVWFM